MARPKRATLTDVNRRNDLVTAAAALFKEKGYHGTTMRDIARATNMQPGSPFYHFASKQDLLYAGVETSLRETLAELQAIDPAGLEPLAYFRALARAHLGRLLGNRAGMVPLVLNEWRNLDGAQRDEVLALRRRFDALWQAAFVRLRKAGIVERADHMSCRLFLGALHGTVGWHDPAGRLSPEKIADALVDFALCGALSRANAAKRKAGGKLGQGADKRPAKRAG